MQAKDDDVQLPCPGLPVSRLVQDEATNQRCQFHASIGMDWNPDPRQPETNRGNDG